MRLEYTYFTLSGENISIWNNMVDHFAAFQSNSKIVSKNRANLLYFSPMMNIFMYFNCVNVEKWFSRVLQTLQLKRKFTAKTSYLFRKNRSASSRHQYHHTCCWFFWWNLYFPMQKLPNHGVVFTNLNNTLARKFRLDMMENKNP